MLKQNAIHEDTAYIRRKAGWFHSLVVKTNIGGLLTDYTVVLSQDNQTCWQCFEAAGWLTAEKKSHDMMRNTRLLLQQQELVGDKFWPA